MIRQILKAVGIITIAMLSILGLLSCIAIVNYSKSVKKGSLAEISYKQNLANKILLDSLDGFEKSYNSDSDVKKDFGYIISWLALHQSDDFTINTQRKNDFKQQFATSILEENSNYVGYLDMDNHRIVKENEIQNEWHWYNWLGIGIR